MKITCPLTHSKNVTLIKRIEASHLVKEYKKQLDIDISTLLKTVTSIDLYKSLDSGYEFYTPVSSSGDSAFYEKLEEFSWYYMPWKWEHAIASDLIPKKSHVLEIGCASGAFLGRMKDVGHICTGIELNKNAAKVARERGISVSSSSLDVFSESHREKYDVVCSFQVLEHVGDVGDFLSDSLSTLKRGGLFIVSVPNNDSFILNENEVILNMPPHHMGLWRTQSLIGLQNIFPLRIENLFLEPLQAYHSGYAKDSMDLAGLKQRVFSKYALLNNYIRPAVNKTIDWSIEKLSPYIIGQSILALYRKV